MNRLPGVFSSQRGSLFKRQHARLKMAGRLNPERGSQSKGSVPKINEAARNPPRRFTSR